MVGVLVAVGACAAGAAFLLNAITMVRRHQHRRSRCRSDTESTPLTESASDFVIVVRRRAETAMPTTNVPLSVRNCMLGSHRRSISDVARPPISDASAATASASQIPTDTYEHQVIPREGYLLPFYIFRYEFHPDFDYHF